MVVARLCRRGWGREFRVPGTGLLVQRKAGTKRRTGCWNRPPPGHHWLEVYRDVVWFVRALSHCCHFLLPAELASSSTVGGFLTAQASAQLPNSMRTETLEKSKDW